MLAPSKHEMSNSKALLEGHSKSVSSGSLSGAILYDIHSADRKKPYNEGIASVSTTKYATGSVLSKAIRAC